MPDGVEAVGDYAFYCHSLTSVRFPETLRSIGANAFYYCRGLKSLSIPDGVSSIGTYAFGECSGLESVTLGEGLASVGSYAFDYCRNIRSVAASQYVCEKGLSSVFGYSYQYVTNIELTAGATNVSAQAFNNCQGLKWFEVAEGNPGYKSVDGYLLTKDGKTLVHGLNGDVVVPDGVEAVGDYAFYCHSLTSVRFPETLRSIGANAFYYCRGLKNLSIPDGVTSVGAYAFYNCSGLARIAFLGDVPSIGSYAFSYLASGCTAYVKNSTSGWPAEGAKWNGLTIAYLKVDIVDDYAWTYCVVGNNVEIYNGDSAAISPKPNGNVVIPSMLGGKPVTTIGSRALAGCSELTGVAIPASVTSIASSAFAGCNGLRSVTLTGDVFSGYTYIPWKTLDMVYYSLVYAKNWMPVFASYGIEEFVPLELIDFTFEEEEVDGNIWRYYVNDGGAVVCAGEWRPAVSDVGNEDALTVPSSLGGFPVVEIGFAAFVGLDDLDTVVLPATVTNIADYAFYECNGLTGISIPSAVESIGNFAFTYCGKLESVTFEEPFSLRHIGDAAFRGCYSIKDDGFVLPSTVVEIGKDALQFRMPNFLTGTISENVRLKDGAVYVVSNNVTVASGATLTIPAGTVLKFNSGVSLTVNSGATLNAIGTRAQPIVFTSLKDDEHGGDTNGDGDKTYAQPGDWKKIAVYGKVNMDYCKLLCGAAGTSTDDIILVSGSSASVTFSNGLMAHGSMYAIGVESGHFYMTNSVVTDFYCVFRHWPYDPVVNCVIYDCTRLSNNNGQKFYNCIIQGIVEAWDWSSGRGNTYSHCVFWNEPGFGLQSLPGSASASARNVWSNPKFVDTENDLRVWPDDFRIQKGSPCVNAGDAANAPEYDYYGQPRDDGAPDVGIYEIAGGVSVNDLAAVAVNPQTASSIIGETLKVSYEVANVGRFAVADQWHDALYIVSSSSGKSYALGEILNPGALGAGETRTFTSRFTMPVVPVGAYRLRLVVNSRRMDVPEGVDMENNVVISDAEIEVVAGSIDAADGASGSVAAGASYVCAFSLPADAGNKLLRIRSVVGGATLYARCGLGFLPVDAASGTALSFSGGEAWLSVPAGTEKVWLVLDNYGTASASYEVDFHDGSLALLGVSPSNIPSSGEVTLEISGAGFTDGCEVSFVGTGTVAPLAVRRVSSGLLVATVDAASFAAGGQYAVTVTKDGEAKTLENALTVEKVAGEPKFWAKLDVPDSMRQGRLVQTCFVEYGNSGTADMPSPVLQVSMTGDGTLGYIGGLSGLKTLQFVAAGDAGSAGILRAGSSHRIRFEIRAGASNKISLHTSEGSTYAPAPWTNAADYLADLSAAATRIGLRGRDATDYVRVFDLAKAVKNGEPSSAICGRIVDENGEGIKDVTLDFTNAAESISCITDGNGVFCTKGLEAGVYEMVAHGVFSIEGNTSIVVSNVDMPLGDVIVRTGGALIVHLVNATKDKVTIAARTENGTSLAPSHWVGDTDAVFSAIPDGSVLVECINDAGCRKSVMRRIFGGGSVSVPIDFSTDGALTVDFESLGMEAPKGFMLYDGTELERIVIMHDDTVCRIDDIAPGDYLMVTFTEKAISNEPIELHVPREVVSALKSTKNIRMALKNNGKSYEVIRRKHEGFLFTDEAVDDAIKYARELLSRTFPPPAVKCEHNITLYAKQSSLRDRFQDELARFQMLETAFEKSIEAKSDIIGENLLGLGVDVVGIFYKLAKKTTIIAKSSAKAWDIFSRSFASYEALKDGSMEWGDWITHVMIFAATDAEFLAELKVIGIQAADFTGALETAWSVGQHVGGLTAGIVAPISDIDEDAVFNRFMGEMQAYEDTLAWTYDSCSAENDDPLLGDPVDNKTPSIPKSCDPNEMVGPEGVGEARYVKSGDWMNYTIYFENKEGFDIADAQEVKVTNPLNEWLDWSTFEMREVAFNNQNDVGLDGLANGTSEVQMTGTGKYVRTTVEMNTDSGVASWYMRVYDPNGDTEGFPTDGSGFLPSNDDTHRGEGYIKYRIKVRDDAPANVVITNSASIIFDYENPIETDPAWWNTVGSPGAQFAASEVEIDEGETAELRVYGGNAFVASSVKLYLTYNTAAAADIDLKTGSVGGMMPKGGLKFPLTLSWEAGEIGEKVVTIPVKTDKTVEDAELFTLQLADAVGIELGDDRVCTVTIHDLNDKTLKAAVSAYKPKRNETVTTNSVGVAIAAGGESGGFVAGTGEYTSGSKLTLTAEARPGWAFAGWRLKDGDGTILSDKVKWQVVVTNDENYVAVFEKIPYVRGLADPAERGKVSGSGLCAAGKKVTLKATANKGFVFLGWTAAQIPLDGDRLVIGAQDYVATTASLVIDRTAKPAKDTATSTTITGVDGDVTYYANFITAEEDKGSIKLKVDGVGMRRVEDNAPYQTNIWAGVYLEWPVVADALSATTVKVAGLPSGLKFADKPVTTKTGSGKTAIVVTNVPANTIYGAPTAASKTKTDRGTGKVTVTPSAVKVTVTTAGKSSQTYQIDTVVDALPAWAVGGFSGNVKCRMENEELMAGVVSLTVSAAGKVSGKALSDGLTYALAAPYYSGFDVASDGEVLVSNFLADVTASWSYKEGSKTVKTNDVVQMSVRDNGIGGVIETALPGDDGGHAGRVTLPGWTAWQYNWKVEPWSALGKSFDKKTMSYVILADGTVSDDEKYATAALGEDVIGRVTLKFTAKGTATVAGEFVSGYDEKKQKYTTVKASGTATLAPIDGDCIAVFVYLTPKNLSPHARCLSVSVVP